jgi:sterol desaturase/sphingolipid hydroxylase (fatty acid hydroxylase superfamily)
VEFIAEIIIQIVWGILQFLGELLLQAFFELIAELIGRSVKEPFRRPKPVNPWFAAFGYIIFGVAAGGLSLWLVPALFISSQWLRIANLILTPVVAGLLMDRLGAWREKKDQETIRLDTFSYGFLFALSMALVRFTWGH